MALYGLRYLQCLWVPVALMELEGKIPSDASYAMKFMQQKHQSMIIPMGISK